MSAARSMSSRALMTTWSSVAAGNVMQNPFLLGLYALLADDGTPAQGFRLHESGECRLAIADGFGAERCHLFLHRFRPQHIDKSGVQLVADLAGRALGHEHAVPADHL